MSVYKNDKLAYLQQAFESIINNSVVPNEIVIVFDGKVINKIDQYLTGKVLELQDIIEIKLIRLEKNVGLGLALREGFKYCSNELIARVDADDVNYLDRFEKQFYYMQRNENIVILGGNVIEFSDDDSSINSKRVVPIKKENIKSFSKIRSPFNHPTVMIRKKAIESVGGYQDFKGFEDYHLWARVMISNYDFENLPEYLVHMRADFYGRRGGKNYFIKYFNLQKYFVSIGLTTRLNSLICVLGMMVSSAMSISMRKIIYKNILRK